MRGFEVVLGSLLIGSGLLGPGFLLGSGPVEDPNVQANATFFEADYIGTAEVSALEAALRTEGPFEGRIQADDVQVTIYRQENKISLNATEPKTGAGVKWDGGFPASYTSTVHRYEDASVELSGLGDGKVRAWPNSSIGDGEWNVSLPAEEEPTIRARPDSVGYWTDDHYYEYHMEGPVFALGHETDSYHQVSTESAIFDQVEAHGAFDLVAENAEVHVRDGDTARTYTVENEQRSVDSDGRVRAGEHIYAVVTVGDANVTFEVPDGVASTFFAKDPIWKIDGRLSFEAREGRTAAGNETVSLSNRTFSVVGNTSLDTEALGGPAEPEEAPPLNNTYGFFGAAADQPPLRGSLESDAEKATVDGEPLQTQIPQSSSVPEEVTLLGKVVGALLLVWSVGKKLIGFVAALLIDDPLDNERRRKVFGYLQEVGMAHMRSIQRATEIPVASLSHHLDVLRNAGLVAKVEENGYTVYFLTDEQLCHDERERLALLADDTRCRIARILVDRGAASQTEIAEDLGLSQGAVSKQINKLREACLVEERGEWPKIYQPSSLIRRWVSSTD